MYKVDALLIKFSTRFILNTRYFRVGNPKSERLAKWWITRELAD